MVDPLPHVDVAETVDIVGVLQLVLRHWFAIDLVGLFFLPFEGEEVLDAFLHLVEILLFLFAVWDLVEVECYAFGG